MNDGEKINLILAEMSRTAVLRAAKSKALNETVDLLTEARIQEAEGKEAQRLAEDEIVRLKQEIASLEAEDQRSIGALMSLQQVIAVTESLVTSIVEPVIEQPILQEEE